MIKIYLENQDHERAIPDSKLRFLNFCYAHGELDHANHYDLISEEKSNHFDKRHNINGEECIAVMPDGNEVEALFFYWKAVHVHVSKKHRWWEHEGEKPYRQILVMPRGLLVAKDDEESIKYAKRAFEEKQKYL